MTNIFDSGHIMSPEEYSTAHSRSKPQRASHPKPLLAFTRMYRIKDNVVFVGNQSNCKAEEVQEMHCVVPASNAHAVLLAWGAEQNFFITQAEILDDNLVRSSMGQLEVILPTKLVPRGLVPMRRPPTVVLRHNLLLPAHRRDGHAEVLLSQGHISYDTWSISATGRDASGETRWRILAHQDAPWLHNLGMRERGRTCTFDLHPVTVSYDHLWKVHRPSGVVHRAHAVDMAPSSSMGDENDPPPGPGEATTRPE